jgi:hypothetical protein
MVQIIAHAGCNQAAVGLQLCSFFAASTIWGHRIYSMDQNLVLVALSGSLTEVPKNGCLSHIQGTRDFFDFEAFFSQSFGSLWLGFRRPLLGS